MRTNKTGIILRITAFLLLLLAFSASGANDGTTIITVFEEDFETGGPSWTASGTWEIGRPLNGPRIGASPTNSAGTDLDAYYANNLNDRLQSPSISLPALSNASDRITMTYNEWLQSESGIDEGVAEISTNGGGTWVELGRVSGTSNIWHESRLSLTPFAGNDVVIGFRFVSDESVRNAGWYIDDVTIEHKTFPPLSGAVVSMNSLNFPYVYLNVAVWTNGTFADALGVTNFTILEDGVEQTERKGVLQPTEGEGQRLVDIVFIMDNSGSMADEQTAIETNVSDFVNGLAAEGIDFSLGLCRYGQGSDNGDPIIVDNGILTPDVVYFTNSVWKRNTDDGATEPGYFSMVESTTKFNYRPGAQKVFIMITDESPDQGGATQQQAIDACVDSGTTLFALTETNLFSMFTPITDPTNGECFDIFSDFNDIMNTIKEFIIQSYLIRYQADDTSADGTTRIVEVVITNAGITASIPWEYIPRSAPKILRTDATLAMHSSSYAPGSMLPVEVRILDGVAPFVESATLYYKNTTNASYSLVTMTNMSGSLWLADIPGSAVQVPGVDYFIMATDGKSTTSDPSMNPYSARFQFSVSPNVAPSIIHIPIALPVLDAACLVTGTVTDVTSSLDSLTLYYRKTGQLLYQSTNMTNVVSSDYCGTIPAEYVTSDGVDYYIRAFDDQGVGSYHGTPDLPHQSLQPTISVSPTLLTANLQTGGSVTQTITVTSHISGSGPLAFELLAGDSAKVEALSFVPVAAFLPTPGNQSAIDVVFDSSGLDAGSYNTDIIILSNDPDNSRVVVTGRLDVTAAPDIGIPETTLDFGSVFLGVQTTQQLEVANNGFAQLNVTSLTCDNTDFVPSALSLSLASGTNEVLDVVFTPGSLGSATGTITVVSNDPDHPTNLVSVTANVLPPPVMTVSPASINVTMPSGGSSNKVVTIGNITGNSDLEFNLSMQGNVVEINPSDSFGYTWLDCNDSGGPNYQWYDITSIGTNSGLSGDDTSVSVTLPFAFQFYGKSRTSVRLSSNGYLTFGDSGSTTSGNIVSTDTPNDTIAPLWDDLKSGVAGTVHTYHDTHTGRFIVQYTNWEPYSGSGLLTFQVHLCSNGNVYFHYKEVADIGFTSIGIENSAGTDGLLIAQSSSYATNGHAVKIFSQDSFMNAGAEQGLIPIGQQFVVLIYLNAVDLPAGTYERNIVITGNDPANPSVTIPLTMTVQGTPDITVDPTSIDFGESYIMNTYTSQVRVVSSGSSALVVNNVTVDDPNFSADTSGFTLPAGEVHFLDVVYSPTIAGSPVSGTLTVNSNDGDEPAVQVSLAGERREMPDINVDTNAVNKHLHVNTTGTYSLVIGNTGLGELSYSISIQKAPNTNVTAYIWKDSNDADGPAYSWTDISSVGLPSGLTGDDNEVTVSLPFTFAYYQEPQTAVKLSSNGYLVLGDDSGTSTSGTVPNTSAPNNVIAPFWNDLKQDTGSCHTYYDSANKRFMIQYTNWGRYSGEGTYTFQVHLCENGSIYFFYQSMVGVIDEAMIGIENSDGTDGIAVADSVSYVQNGLAVSFLPSDNFLDTEVAGGTLSSGGSTSVVFKLDASNLAYIDYDADIVISSNDPDESEIRIPVHLDVDGLFINLTYTAWEELYWSAGGSGGQSADYDFDGSSNFNEWLAGTDPTRNDSILKLIGGSKDGDLSKGFLVEWPSIGGRVYTIESSETIIDGFTGVVSGIVATPPWNEYNITNQPALNRCYYRIKTSKP